jgi:hypothetical protein
MPDDESSEAVQQETVEHGSEGEAVSPPSPPDNPRPENTQPVATQSVTNEIRGLEGRIRGAEKWMIYLTSGIVLLTAGMVIVGILQWNAMQGQLGEMKSGGADTKNLAISTDKQATTADAALTLARDNFRREQRPYIWFTLAGAGQIEFHQTPRTDPPSGQILWTFHITNYGRSPAYGFQHVREEIKIGDSPFKVIWQREYKTGGQGTVIPPTKDDFATVVSDPGIALSEFNRLLGIDNSIQVRVRMNYSDGDGFLYETGFCESRLTNGGSIKYCDEGNYIKELPRPQQSKGR